MPLQLSPARRRRGCRTIDSEFFSAGVYNISRPNSDEQCRDIRALRQCPEHAGACAAFASRFPPVISRKALQVVITFTTINPVLPNERIRILFPKGHFVSVSPSSFTCPFSISFASIRSCALKTSLVEFALLLFCFDCNHFPVRSTCPPLAA